MDIFNFSSATRFHFSNVNTVLATLATWSKNCNSDFLKDGLVLRETCMGGIYFNLKVIKWQINCKPHIKSFMIKGSHFVGQKPAYGSPYLTFNTIEQAIIEIKFKFKKY